MDKWADFLISEVNYDSDHLISLAKRHQDTEKGISLGDIIDRLTIASDIKNGLVYTTIYSAKNSWKKGNKIRVFSLKGNPYLRIDNNKVNLDFLGDLPEISIPSEILISEPVEEEPTAEQLAKIKQLEKQIQELESVPEPEPTPKPSSPRGSLPKESSEELPQQLVPEPEPTPVEEEPTAEQLPDIDNLKNRIEKLHDTFSSSYNIGEQSLAYKKLEENLETLDSEKNESISNILQKHQKQLDTIEKFLNRKKKI